MQAEFIGCLVEMETGLETRRVLVCAVSRGTWTGDQVHRG